MIGTSHILRLREYERATIGDAWDPSRKTIPQLAVGELERLQALHGQGMMEISRRTIRALNFVGTIGLGDRAIEILPKVDGDDGAVRNRLIEMLSIAGAVPHLEGGITALAPTAHTVLDAFMQAYLRELTLQWRRGRIADYRRETRNRSALRGKLVFAEQLRRNHLHPERFFSSADEFLVDNQVSRLLKAGVEVCRRTAPADMTRRSAATLLPEFEDVGDQHWSQSELDGVQTDRRSERFAPLLWLAKMLLRTRLPDRPGAAKTYSLLFDMNEVFERYIGNLLRRVCPSPLRVQLQAGGRSLFTRGGKPAFRLYPDVAVRRGEGFVCVLDTKWKRLDLDDRYEGVRQSDAYQAYAYAREFGCRCVVLLYPVSSVGSQGRVASYTLSPLDGESQRVEVWTADVSLCARDLGRQLQNVVLQMVSTAWPQPSEAT